MQTNWARVKLILLETFIKNFWGFSASFVLLLLLLFSSFLWNTYMYLIYICFINITSIIHTYIVCQIHLPPYVGILRNLIHRLPGKVFSSFFAKFWWFVYEAIGSINETGEYGLSTWWKYVYLILKASKE